MAKRKKVYASQKDIFNIQGQSSTVACMQKKYNFSGPEGIRTPNQQNRNLSFYPIELRVLYLKCKGNILHSDYLSLAKFP